MSAKTKEKHIMSRRIATYVVALAVAGTVLVPASSYAQANPGSRADAKASTWISALWNRVLDQVTIDGSWIASQIGIEIHSDSDEGAGMDANGRPTSTSQPGA